MKLDTPTKIDNQEIQNFIISKIGDLIIYKNLEPGDKLPSERVLSEKFDVSRRNVREAIQKLEYYELVKSIPQTGTFIANIGQIALKGIIEDLLRLNPHDCKSLLETRILLELKTVELAAERRTEEELLLIEEAFTNFKAKILNKESALQEDLLFHLAIAKASGNSTLNALMLQIIPKIITVFESKNRVFSESEKFQEFQVHLEIYEAIKNKNVARAVENMETHLKGLIEFCDDTLKSK